MDEAVENATTRVNSKEAEAIEQHHHRLAKARQDLRIATDQAITTITQFTEQCVAQQDQKKMKVEQSLTEMGAQQEADQKQRLLEYCAEQTNNLASDLDNFAGQAWQIQQEILAGVRGREITAKTVTIDDDDRSPKTESPPTQIKKPTRWHNVDEEAIRRGVDHQKETSRLNIARAGNEMRYTRPEYPLSRLRKTQTPIRL